MLGEPVGVESGGAGPDTQAAGWLGQVPPGQCGGGFSGGAVGGGVTARVSAAMSSRAATTGTARCWLRTGLPKSWAALLRMSRSVSAGSAQRIQPVRKPPQALLLSDPMVSTRAVEL